MSIRILIIVFLFAGAGCVAKPVKSQLLKTCLEIKEAAYLWEAFDNVYVGSFLLTFAESQPQLSRGKVLVGVVKKGTQLEVIQVLRGSNGSYGPFLRARVQIQSGESQGITADVPSCVPYHPQPRVQTSCTLEPNELTFNEDLIVECRKI